MEHGQKTQIHISDRVRIPGSTLFINWLSFIWSVKKNNRDFYLNWQRAVTILWWVSITPFGKPVVPLENGMVARSLKTSSDGGWHDWDRPESSRECHSDCSLLAEKRTEMILGWRESFSFLSFETVPASSTGQIQKSALLMTDTCSNSPVSLSELLIETNWMNDN